jgi:cytochrome c peroxidase
MRLPLPRRGAAAHLLALGLTLNLAACGAPAPTWTWQLPPGFPQPFVPADNAMSVEKVALGRRLFFDTRLSRNQVQACATCHDQKRAFTDGLVHAEGSTGQHHRRNAQALANVGYASALTWANPLVTSLERQALLPLLGETPVELGWSGRDDELVARLAGDADLAKRFLAAFPEEKGAVTLATVTKALAAFERTLISGNAPWDKYQAGQQDAVSDAARRGAALFNTERLECYHCHNGFSFTDTVLHAATTNPERIFHNTGLYDLDRMGTYPPTDQGVYEVSHQANDMGRFRAPTLRNLRFTAPYLHDGSAATLDDVLDAYAAGGRAALLTGHASPLQSDLVRGFTLSADERADLKAFLDALNDDDFTTRSDLGPP